MRSGRSYQTSSCGLSRKTRSSPFCGRRRSHAPRPCPGARSLRSNARHCTLHRELQTRGHSRPTQLRIRGKYPSTQSKTLQALLQTVSPRCSTILQRNICTSLCQSRSQRAMSTRNLMKSKSSLEASRWQSWVSAANPSSISRNKRKLCKRCPNPGVGIQRLLVAGSTSIRKTRLWDPERTSPRKHTCRTATFGQKTGRRRLPSNAASHSGRRATRRRPRLTSLLEWGGPDHLRHRLPGRQSQTAVLIPSSSCRTRR
mmetsp:Transcript_74584/g.242203  ORF Transcript_74584/g.242203 Transcript_74584/m.242203 type:complete len:257 (+) Transcript_74584:1187-1957(+)